MCRLLGPAAAAAVAAFALIPLAALFSQAGCVVECREDKECGLPYRRCHQNTCVECLTKEDCGPEGAERMCWHGFCCDGSDRACYTHTELPDTSECRTTADCAAIYGYRNDPKNECTVLSESCVPNLPFCSTGTCNECRIDKDCESLSPGANLECTMKTTRMVCAKPEQ